MSTATGSTRQLDPKVFVGQARPAVVSGDPLVLAVGGSEMSCSKELGVALLEVIDLAMVGAVIDITGLPKDLSTGQVAELLGVSRPTVVSLIDSGKLPATRVNAHRRINTVDAMEYRARARTDAATERSVALDDLEQLSDEFGLYES